MFASAPIRLSSSFSWPVAVEGYRLHSHRIPAAQRSPEGYQTYWDEVGREHVLKEAFLRHGERCIAPKVDCTFEMRRPLEDSSLFLTFANLDFTESAVAKFASRHGLLAIGAVSRKQPPMENGEPLDGESLEDQWYGAIRSLRLGVALWNAGRANAKQSVQAIVSDPQYAEVWQFSSGTLFSATELPAWPDKGQIQTPEDALHAAHAIALARFEAVAWRFTRTLPKNRHVLELAPNSLGSALWMQFACAIASDARYRSCEYEGCGGFFDASATRKSRRYCSNSCKTRAYNKRHALGTAASAPKPTVSKDT